MSASETPFADAADTAPVTPGGDRTRAILERQIHVLGDLFEAGLVMARAVAREISEPREERLRPREIGELALAGDRIARAVRYTMVLQGRLLSEFDAWESAQEPVQPSRAEVDAPAAGAEPEGQGRKAQVAEVLGRIIAAEHAADMQGEAPETETRQRREREAAERLRSEAGLADILTLPVSEVIDRICRGLGIQPDWLRLSEEDWARGELRSGKVGAALAAAVLAGAPPDDPHGDPSGEAGGRRTPLSRPSWRPPLRAAKAHRRRRAAG